jgi:hypothetical protein
MCLSGNYVSDIAKVFRSQLYISILFKLKVITLKILRQPPCPWLTVAPERVALYEGLHLATSKELFHEKFEDAKVVIRSCKLKDRQCNG